MCFTLFAFFAVVFIAGREMIKWRLKYLIYLFFHGWFSKASLFDTKHY